MLGRTNTGGGGGGLNFQVIGGTTAPSNPKENMIWVNTSTKITSYIFSAEEPTNPTPGMVWISTGTSSTVEFNALKKNSVQVYPLSARLYMDGAFKPVNAYMYRDGTWVQWAYAITYLYNRGDKCDDITGGWRFNMNQGGGAVGSITYNTDNVVLKQVGNQNTFVTVNALKLDKYNKLEIVYKYDLQEYSGPTFCQLGLVDNNTQPRPTLALAADMPESDAENTVELDISTVDTDLHVCVTQQYKGIVTIYEIRLS